MNKKIKILIIVISSVLVIFLLALPKLNSGKSNTENNNAGNQKLSVTALIINSETLQDIIKSSGSVMANEEVELKSETAGKILNIYFKEGSAVNKGDLLVKINDSELQAQLSRAQYRLKLQEDREYRQKILFGKEAISQEEYDVSLNELNVSRAEVELIKAQVEKTEIQAPFNGIIGLRNVSEGSYVTSATVIATLQNINPVKIDFSIPERYAAKVKAGDAVNFTVTGAPGNYIAKVYAIEPKIDPVTRTLKIRAVYSNPRNEIFPGAFANIELVLAEMGDAILIPTQAVIPELKGQKVFIYRNGSAVPQPIETGIRNDQRVQVTKGLNVNDTLITSGILQIRPGIPVNIKDFN
jgi:membrane fusion protein (multidrug efflux system)